MKGKMRTVVDAHRAILEAIDARNDDRAAAAMREHLSGTVQRLDALKQGYPDFFS
jgi:DNA-binding GntR family transcriptional regulator